MNKKTWKKSQFIKAVAENISIRQVLFSLNLIPAGGNYHTVNHFVKKWKLDTSHWLGQSANQGERYKGGPIIKNIREYLKEDIYISGNNMIKRRLIHEGFLKNRCDICKIRKWLDKNLSLHLDHINGNKRDYRLENLRLLCPNCHSQTDTYCRSKSSLAKKINAPDET